MKEVIKKEILVHLKRVVEILKVREPKDFGELKELSEHTIEDVALHKDLDLIAMTVLIYSLYKIVGTMTEKEGKVVVNQLETAITSLEANNFGRYNSSIKSLYVSVRKCNARVKQHLQDVMQAARIKKGTTLLERGLSIGQAAGLMGLSNWDLQVYAGKTTVLEQHRERKSAKMRVTKAFKIFGV